MFYNLILMVISWLVSLGACSCWSCPLDDFQSYYNPLSYSKCHEGKFDRFDWMHSKGSDSFICDLGQSQHERWTENIRTSSRRIIEGFNNNPVRLGEFPSYVAYIHPFNRTGNICGGIILNEFLVLTAAHCVRTELPGAILLAGDTLLSLQSKVGQKRSASRVCWPNEFSPEAALDKQTILSLTHDWAIVEVDEDFEWSNSVQPGCVNIDFELNQKSMRCVAVGVGSTEKGHEDKRKRLEVRGAVLEACNSNTKGPPAPDVMCMSPVSNRNSSGGGQICPGDSGGPLYCYENCKGSKPRMYSVGIASRINSTRCDVRNLSYFTSTSSHREAIARLIGIMTWSRAARKSGQLPWRRSQQLSTSGFKCYDYCSQT